MKFFGSATMGVKGQVVIPAEAREAFNLKEKEKLLVFSAPMDKGVVLIKADSLDSLIEALQEDARTMQELVSNPKEDKNE